MYGHWPEDRGPQTDCSSDAVPAVELRIRHPGLVAASEQLALERAVEKGDVGEAARLLEGGADPNGRCHGLDMRLMNVVLARGDSAILALFHRHGAEINPVDQDGRSRLHRAAGSRDGSRELALMLEFVADPNAPDGRGWTSLHFAAAYGYYSNVVLLLEHGADPDALTGDGLRPADLAARNQHQRIVDRLIGKQGSGRRPGG